MTPLRSLLVVALIIGVVVLSASPRSQPAANELAPFWTDPADVEWNRRMHARSAAIVRRIDQKTRIVDEVRAGRLTRTAAVGKFREWLNADPELLDEYRYRQPGVTDDELALENFVRHLSVTDHDQ